MQSARTEPKETEERTTLISALFTLRNTQENKK